MTPERVARSYYTIAGLYTLAASLIWGVNTLFLLSAGLNIFEVFIANSAYSLGTVIFEIPTGVVADTLGRRISFLASVAVLTVTTLLYVGLDVIGAGVWAFAGVSILMGLGFTFYSGAVEAWLVDALNATGFEGNLDRIFARGQFIGGAAMLIGTVGGGFLGQVDLKIPFLVRALALVILFFVALVLMHDVGFSPRRVGARQLPREMRAQARDGVSFGWRSREIRLLIMASFVQTGFFIWAFYAWQPYFLELLGRDVVWVAGVMSALIAISMMAGNALVELFTRVCGRRTTLLLWAAAVMAVAAVGVGLADSFWIAAPVFLLFTGAMGVTMPVRQSYIHHIVPSDKRATVVSFDSMISGAGGMGGQAGLGALAQAQSIGSAYVVGGAATALALPFLVGVRRIGGTADQISGQRAGTEGCTPAQGLPAIATVDSTTRDEFEPSA